MVSLRMNISTNIPVTGCKLYQTSYRIDAVSTKIYHEDILLLSFASIELRTDLAEK